MVFPTYPDATGEIEPQRRFSVTQHGFYAEACGTPSLFGNAGWHWYNLRSSGILRFVRGVSCKPSAVRSLLPMGVYVQLDCLDCDESLSFGKPIRRSKDGGIVLQGLFSEREHAWIDDVRCWHAIQAYLIKHRDHRLVFRTDDSADAQETDESEFDDLLDSWTNGLPDV